jgi:predicted membrane protein
VAYFTARHFLVPRSFGVLLGTVIPLALLGLMQIFPDRGSPLVRRAASFASVVLILLGVLAMRWNVVIGGQLFSKSLRGFTTYKLELLGQEGLFMSVVLLLLPFAILAVLVKLLLPREPALPEQPLSAAGSIA